MKFSKLKRNDKIGLFFFVAFILSSTLFWLFEERFDQTKWFREPKSRYQMVDDLIESQLLIDKTENEVIQLLGAPYSKIENNRHVYFYRLGTPPSFFKPEPEQLLVEFELGSVSNVTLAVDDN